MSTNEKPCSRCKVTKPLSDFYVNKRMKLGRMSECKKCIGKRVARYSKTENGKEVRIKSMAKFSKTEKCKEWRKRYLLTEKGKEVLIKRTDRYAHSLKGKATHIRAAKIDRARYPTKHRARMAVSAAVRRGKLIRPTECSNCPASGVPIEGHHADYSKPLDVDWLCRKCHRAIHNQQVYEVISD